MDKSADNGNVSWQCRCEYEDVTLTKYSRQLCRPAVIVLVVSTCYQDLFGCIFNFKYIFTLICERERVYLYTTSPWFIVRTIDRAKLRALATAPLVLICVHSMGELNVKVAMSARKVNQVNMEKTLESPLDCKEIQPVHSEGDQSWVFIGRTDAKAETPVFWPPHAKSWLIGKDPDAGRDWGQEEKGMAEDEMAGWHHWLTQWMWVWVNSRSWWYTGRPGVLWFMGLQRVRHDLATEVNWNMDKSRILGRN